MRLTVAAVICGSLLPAKSWAQSYCAPTSEWRPAAPVVTYYSPATGAYCSPLPGQSACVTTYNAPATACYAPATTYSGPGHSLRAPTQTNVTVINSTASEIALWVVFLDQTGVEHKSNVLKVAPGAKVQVGQMAESPKMLNDKNLAIAVRSESGAFLKGSSQGTPLNQVFYQDCRDGTIAVGLTLH